MAPALLSVRRPPASRPSGMRAAQNGSGWRAPDSLAPRVYTATARRTDIPTGPAVTDVPIDLRLAAVDPTSVAIGSAGQTPKHTVLGATPGNGVRPRGASIPAGAAVLKIGKAGTRITTEGESSRTGAAAVGARRARRTPCTTRSTMIRVSTEVGEVDLADVCRLARYYVDASDRTLLFLSLDGQIKGPRWEIIHFERSARPASRRIGATSDRHPYARNRPRAGDNPPGDRPRFHYLSRCALH
jgi:hypothetical protein